MDARAHPAPQPPSPCDMPCAWASPPEPLSWRGGAARSAYRGGGAEKRFSAGKTMHVQKRSERVHFRVWPARTNLEGAGSGRGAIIYLRILAVTGSNPTKRVRFFLLVFGALGRKTQRAQTGGLCAVAMEKGASLGVGRASLFFWRFSPMRILRFMELGER